MNSRIVLLIANLTMIGIIMGSWATKGNTIQRDQLVGYWNFDNKGDLGKDGSDYGNHGDNVGNVDWPTLSRPQPGEI